jgi:hypothetical protein
MATDKFDQKTDDRADAGRLSDREMTIEQAKEIFALRENTQMTQQEIASKLGLNQGPVTELIAHFDRFRGHPDLPFPGEGTRSRLEVLFEDLKRTGGSSGPEARPDDDLSPDDRIEAVVHHFGELSAALEAIAELLHLEVADELRERRAELAQMDKTQDSIQKKIDEANAWLARRAG